jgi:DNA-binding phage protein
MTRTAPRRDLGRHTISAQLRDVIDSRGLSAYAVAKLAGVDKAQLARFLSGERDLRLETVDRTARAQGLRLVEVGRARGKGRPPGSARADAGAGDDASGRR